MAISAIPPQLRRKILPSIANVTNRIHQMPGWPVLQKVAIRSGPHHFPHDLVIGSTSKNNELGTSAFGPNPANQLDTMHQREIHINHCYPWSLFANLLQGLGAILATRNHCDVRGGFQHRGQAVATQRVVVSQQDRKCFSCGHNGIVILE